MISSLIIFYIINLFIDILREGFKLEVNLNIVPSHRKRKKKSNTKLVYVWKISKDSVASSSSISEAPPAQQNNQEQDPTNADLQFVDADDGCTTYTWDQFDKVKSLEPYQMLLRHQNTCLFSTAILRDQ